MTTQNNNNKVLNVIVNISSLVFLAGAISSLAYTIYTFVNIIF